MSIQRFTAAHELGHFTLQHQPSLDDDSILRRMPMAGAPTADSRRSKRTRLRAVTFMIPRWLILWHADRQGWRVGDLRRLSTVYQLALRIGASYGATCWTLVRHRFIQTLLFWSAFILTRPLSATVGDFLDKPLHSGGLALSRFYASAVLAAFIIVCILLIPQRAVRHPGKRPNGP